MLRAPLEPFQSHLLLSAFITMETIKWIFACLICVSLNSSAQVNDVGRNLKVLPAPKEVRLGVGRLLIKNSTQILIDDAEERIAAETLQEEIYERTGVKLPIETSPGVPRTPGSIWLGRVNNRGLRSSLELQGVKLDDPVSSA